MNWSALTKKQQVMVIGTVVIAVAQIFVLIHFLGGQDSGDLAAKSSKLELTQLEEKIDQARLVLAKSDMIQTALDETIARLEELSTYSPTMSDRYAWAYEYVSLRAAKSGVELDSLEEIVSTAGNEKTPPPEQAYEIRLSTQCGYNQLVDFLWRVENDNPLVRVKNVDITAVAESPDRHKVWVSLQWPAGLKIERGIE